MDFARGVAGSENGGDAPGEVSSTSSTAGRAYPDTPLAVFTGPSAVVSRSVAPVRPEFPSDEAHLSFARTASGESAFFGPWPEGSETRASTTPGTRRRADSIPTDYRRSRRPFGALGFPARLDPPDPASAPILPLPRPSLRLDEPNREYPALTPRLLPLPPR